MEDPKIVSLSVCVCVCLSHLAELVVCSQVVSVVAAGLGAQQCHVAVVFACRDIAVGGLELVVEGGGGEAQRVSADVLVAGGDEVHGRVYTSLQVRQRQEGLQ